jgi:hypothetical protein
MTLEGVIKSAVKETRNEDMGVSDTRNTIILMSEEFVERNIHLLISLSNFCRRNSLDQNNTSVITNRVRGEE